MATVNRRQPWRLAAVLVAIACSQDIVLVGLTTDEANTVRRYLDCIDCVIPLDSVRALATRKPDPTVDSLNSGLLNGPGLAAVAAADSVLRRGFIRDSSWRVQNNLIPYGNRDSVVAEARNRFINGFRSRGAYGLGWIHTPRAVAYLDSALLSTSVPAVVKQAVRYALDSLPPP